MTSDPAPHQDHYDVVVVGGGHNGLVAGTYLAQAGMSVLLLERLGRTGGAVASEELFAGVPARLSRYAYSVGMVPDRIVRELGLDVQFRSGRTASFTPAIRRGTHAGLLVERQPSQATADSFAALTGSEREYERWASFYSQLETFSEVLAPSLLEPLVTEQELRRRVDPGTWEMLVDQPLGTTIEDRFSDDLVRGVVATDALKGTFADMHDPTLQQNRCFLYHVAATANGGWKVPLGGMGELAASLERAMRKAGGDVLTGAFVQRVLTDGSRAQVRFQHGGRPRAVECDWVLGNVSPWVLDLLQGNNPGPRPEGCQIKINMLLDKLPRLRAQASPPMAFGGTFHVGENYHQLQQSYVEAQEGEIPETPPGELHCHSLTDPSILGTLAMEGKHAVTFFGMHTPARLYSGHVEPQRDETVLRILDTINVYLEEPIEALLSLDEDGNPCLEAQAPQDVEAQLAMPGGHIYHGPLSWPWADAHAPLETAAAQWGVETATSNVLVCGAGAVRGGAVSGVGGHNAAMAVLQAAGLPLPAADPA